MYILFEIKCIYEYIYNIYIIYLNINIYIYMYKLSASCYHTCAKVHEIIIGASFWVALGKELQKLAPIFNPSKIQYRN